MNRTESLKGIIYAILSSSTFGFAPFFTLLLIDGGLSSFEVLFYRWGVAAIALACTGIAAKQSFRIGWQNFATVCMLGIARAMTSLSLVYAYQNISTGVASSIHFLYPLAVACGMALFFRERISWKVIAAIIASLAGAICLSSDDLSSGGENAVVGITAACLSVLFYGTYIIGVRKTRVANMDSAVLTFYVTAFGGVLFGIGSLIFNGGIQIVSGWKMWLCVLGIALPTTALSNITLVQAIKRIGPTMTSLFGAMEPLTAMVVGILAFGERFTWLTAVGMVLVIVAVSSVVLNSAAAERASAGKQDDSNRALRHVN